MRWYDTLRVEFASDSVRVGEVLEGLGVIDIAEIYQEQSEKEDSFGLHDVILNCVVVAKSRDRDIFREKRRVLFKETQSAAGAGSQDRFCYLPEGYRIPFSFLIPESCSGSFCVTSGARKTSISSSQDVLCEVSGFVEMEIVHYELGKQRIAKISRSFAIANRASEGPGLVVRKELKKGVLSKSVGTVVCSLDKPQYVLRNEGSDSIKVNIKLPQHSRTPVKKVQCFIIQHTQAKLTASSKRKKSKHTVGQSTVANLTSSRDEGGESICAGVAFNNINDIPVEATRASKSHSKDCLSTSLHFNSPEFCIFVKYSVDVKITLKDSSQYTFKIPINVTRDGNIQTCHHFTPPQYPGFIHSPTSPATTTSEKSLLGDELVSSKPSSFNRKRCDSSQLLLDHSTSYSSVKSKNLSELKQNSFPEHNPPCYHTLLANPSRYSVV